jgi:hypothetical protein
LSGIDDDKVFQEHSSPRVLCEQSEQFLLLVFTNFSLFLPLPPLHGVVSKIGSIRGRREASLCLLVHMKRASGISMMFDSRADDSVIVTVEHPAAARMQGNLVENSNINVVDIETTVHSQTLRLR